MSIRAIKCQYLLDNSDAPDEMCSGLEKPPAEKSCTGSLAVLCSGSAISHSVSVEHNHTSKIPQWRTGSWGSVVAIWNNLTHKQPNFTIFWKLGFSNSVPKLVALDSNGGKLSATTIFSKSPTDAFQISGHWIPFSATPIHVQHGLQATGVPYENTSHHS